MPTTAPPPPAAPPADWTVDSIDVGVSAATTFRSAAALLLSRDGRSVAPGAVDASRAKLHTLMRDFLTSNPVCSDLQTRIASYKADADQLREMEAKLAVDQAALRQCAVGGTPPAEYIAARDAAERLAGDVLLKKAIVEKAGADLNIFRQAAQHSWDAHLTASLAAHKAALEAEFAAARQKFIEAAGATRGPLVASWSSLLDLVGFDRSWLPKLPQ